MNNNYFEDYMAPKQQVEFRGEIVPEDVMAPTDDAYMLIIENDVTILGSTSEVLDRLNEAAATKKSAIFHSGKFAELEKLKNNLASLASYGNLAMAKEMPIDNRCNVYTLPGKINIGVNISSRNNTTSSYFLPLER